MAVIIIHGYVSPLGPSFPSFQKLPLLSQSSWGCDQHLDGCHSSSLSKMQTLLNRNASKGCEGSCTSLLLKFSRGPLEHKRLIVGEPCTCSQQCSITVYTQQSYR